MSQELVARVVSYMSYLKMFKPNYFLIGLTLFYIISSFVPNKVMYIMSYFAAAFFFYLHFKDIAVGLIFSLILALFSELGNNGNLLFFGLYIILLLPFSFKKKFDNLKNTDYLIFYFFLLNFILIFFNPYPDVLTGIFLLGEMVCIYYLFRLHLRASHLKLIMFLILTMTCYQLLLGSLQIVFGRNIGLIGEAAMSTNPYGNTAVEEENLYRITASFGHANMYSIVLIVLLPFLFYLENPATFILKIIYLVNLFFTYSRGAWLIGVPVFIIFLYKSKTRLLKIPKKIDILFRFIILLGITYFMIPYIMARLNTIPQAFESSGSFGLRIKLYQEAFNILRETPIIGIGWNRFQTIANELHVTDIFPVSVFTATTKIHNLFLEIATEVGSFGLIVFVLFIISVFNYYFIARKKENTYILKIKKLSIISYLSLLIISLIHPVYLINQFRFFFLLSAIILV